MIESVETTIDDVEYRFMPLMADPARKNLDELLKRFGPAIASVIEGLNGTNKIEDFDMDKTEDAELIKVFSRSLGGGIREFTQALSSHFHKELVDVFLTQVDVKEDGSWVKLTSSKRQMLFGTKLATETRLLVFCLGAQYSDFFGPLRTAIMSAALKMTVRQSNSNSLKTSIGQSGE